MPRRHTMRVFAALPLLIFALVTVSSAFYPDQFWWVMHGLHNGPRWWMNLAAILTTTYSLVLCFIVTVFGKHEMSNLFSKLWIFGIYLFYISVLVVWYWSYGHSLTIPNHFAIAAPVSMMTACGYMILRPEPKI